MSSALAGRDLESVLEQSPGVPRDIEVKTPIKLEGIFNRNTSNEDDKSLVSPDFLKRSNCESRAKLTIFEQRSSYRPMAPVYYINKE